MSRRSSVSSSVSASAKSGTEDDPLMRDCYDLRRRLLQTEQSLQSLNPPTRYGCDLLVSVRSPHFSLSLSQ